MLKDFFRNKSGAQRLMIGAVLLNFVSQFFLYSDGSMVPMYTTDYSGFMHVIFPDGLGLASGWELHWHAGPILIVLAFLYFRDDVVDSPWFSRFGWWLSVVLLFAATVPAALDAWGWGMLWGYVSVIVAIVAAVRHGRDRKKLGAASVAPAAPKP